MALKEGVPTVVTTDGTELYDRECHKSTKHDPHLWKTYIHGGTTGNSPDNAMCRGTGIPPVIGYTSSYVAKVMKDYSTDAENFPVSKKITVAQAKKIAYDMHKDQTDKNKEPYRLHLSAVEQGVRLFGGTDEERIAALFHDAVEDLHTTYDLLRKINVTEHTITMIEAVSKRTSEEQSLYLGRIIAAGEGAMRVKLADLIHNTRHDRMAALPEYTRDRLLKKYRPSMARLMLELGIIVDEDEQKKLATKPQGSSYGHWTSGYGSSGKSSTSVSNVTTHGKKSTPTTPTGRGQAWAVTSLFRGDWVAHWSAPILIRHMPETSETDSVTFTLANGEIRTEKKRGIDGKDKKFFAYSRDEWEVDSTITFNGVSEDDVLDFMNVMRGEVIEEKLSLPDDAWEDQHEHTVIGGKPATYTAKAPEEEDFLWDAGL